MNDVILHAIKFYKNKTNLNFNKVLLLQPTSPIRKEEDLNKVFKSFNNQLDMVMSVALSKVSPEFNLYEDASFGMIKKVLIKI